MACDIDLRRQQFASVRLTYLDGAPVYLAKNAWDVGYVSERNPAIRFTKTKERV